MNYTNIKDTRWAKLKKIFLSKPDDASDGDSSVERWVCKMSLSSVFYSNRFTLFLRAFFYFFVFVTTWLVALVAGWLVLVLHKFRICRIIDNDMEWHLHRLFTAEPLFDECVSVQYIKWNSRNTIMVFAFAHAATYQEFCCMQFTFVSPRKCVRCHLLETYMIVHLHTVAFAPVTTFPIYMYLIWQQQQQ